MNRFTTIEFLIPNLKGDIKALKVIVDEKPNKGFQYVTLGLFVRGFYRAADGMNAIIIIFKEEK